MTSTEERPPLALGLQKGLRRAALIALLAGSVVAAALTLYAGRNNSSRILTILFVVWVLSPFLGAAFAILRWRRGSALTRATLDVAAVLLTFATLAAYALHDLGYWKVKTGTVFLMVPLVFWLLLGIVLMAAAFSSRGKSQRA